MDKSTTQTWEKWLGTLTTPQLSTLLKLRADVVVPPPHSIVVLATRLRQQRSLRRALTTLDRPTLHLLASVATSTTPTLPPPGTEHLVGALMQRALLYPVNTHYLLAPGVSDLLPHLPLDLLANPPLRDAAALRATIADLPLTQRRLLNTLAESGRRGSYDDLNLDDHTHPLVQLLDADLLRCNPSSPTTVLLPEDVTAALHGTCTGNRPNPLDQPQPTAQDNLPINTTTSAASNTSLEDHNPATTGADTIALALHHLRTVIDAIDDQPVRTLLDGGVGQRELNRLRTHTGLDIPHIILSLEALAALRIIDDPLHTAGEWATTIHTEDFLGASPDHQWLALIEAWWASPRPWSGTPQQRALALHPDAAHAPTVVLRRRLLTTLRQWPHTTASATVTDVANLMHWRYPLQGALCGGESFTDILTVGHWLGLLHHNTLTTVGRSLPDSEESTPHDSATTSDNAIAAATTEALAGATPHLIVQDDHTIIVQGFLSAQNTTLLRTIAHVESPGIATVYRLTEDKLRGALETGLTANTILSFLTTLSATPLPQSLEYLVEDCARRHGMLRIAPAYSVLHSDDPSLISSVLSSPLAQEGRIRSLSPTVAIAQLPPRELHTLLHTAGYSPALEDNDGDITPLTRYRIRAASPSPTTPPQDSTLLPPHHYNDIAARLHVSEENTRLGGPEVTGKAILPVLNDAIAHRRPLILSYVKGSGVEAQLRVLPLGLLAGRLDAEELTTRRPYRLPLHIIRSLRVIDPDHQHSPDQPSPPEDTP